MVAVKDKIDVRDARLDESLVNDFFEQNKKLAFSVANEYYNSGIERDDLVAIATLGMFKAFRTFDINCDLKFSTYAVRVMKNEIGMELRRAYYKNRKKFQSLDFVISAGRSDDEDLTIASILEAPEPEYKMEDFEELKFVLEKFKEKFKDTEPRYIRALEMHILEQRNSTDIGKEFGVGQPQGSKIAKRAVMEFQKVALELGAIDKLNGYYVRKRKG